MLWGRKTLPEYERYYNNYLKGFEHAGICSTADLLGVRESRRIKGDYELCAQDFLDRAVFEDEIGRYCYPVDIHIMAPDKESYEAFKAEYARFSYAPGEPTASPTVLCFLRPFKRAGNRQMHKHGPPGASLHKSYARLLHNRAGSRNSGGAGLFPRQRNPRHRYKRAAAPHKKYGRFSPQRPIRQLNQNTMLCKGRNDPFYCALLFQIS